MRIRPIVTLAICLMAGGAFADVVVPNAFAATEAPSTFSLTSTTAGGRTYQMTIAASQLSGQVGENLTGIQWRLNNAATAAWPSVLTSYTQWDIAIGPGVAPSAMSNTFASNFTAGTTTVRSGPHSFNAGDFAIGGSGSTPNPWGPTLVFTTNYLYTGGDLCLEMRFSAQSGATNQPALDAVAATDTANGWGTLFAGRWTASSTGTSGNNANFLVTKFSSTPVPEPATFFVIGIGLLAALRMRKR